MLDHWLRSLSDDYLLAWSNRGLMRRAGKLVEALDPGAVALEDDSARGTIEGHRQTLEGVGFDHARCSCPATGQCHHLVAFLVALRALAGTGDAVPGDAEPADAGDAEPQAAIEPYWRSESDEALVRALGRAHVRRAERWLADDVAMQWEEAQGELRARIDDDAAGGQSTVRMPALGGLGASVCSCKAPTSRSRKRCQRPRR